MQSNALLKCGWRLSLMLFSAAISSASAQSVTDLIDFNHNWKYDQSATDLGTAWRAPTFDDSSWSSGNGALGYPTSENLLGEATVQTTLDRFQSDGTTQILTYYYRTHFTFSGSTAGATLVSTNLIDDGAIVYLNGTEVGRIAMPAGTVNYSTLASRQNDISEAGHGLDVLTIPASSLQAGDNVLAVEVHQGGNTSSDSIFAMKLVAIGPADVDITTQPQSLAVSPGSPATFTVDATGSQPIFFQWRKNGVNIPSATAKSYTIPSAATSDEGTYSVVVSNAVSTATSMGATLTVSTTSPVVITRDPISQSVAVGGLASFSVGVSGSSPFTYQWYKNGAPIPNATRIVYTIASVDQADAGSYYVVVSNAVGSATSGTASLFVAQPPFVPVGYHDTWKYNATGQNLGTAWREIGYNDSSWSSGTGIFAVENNQTVLAYGVGTTLSLTPPGGGPEIITYYFRKHFTITNSPSSLSLLASNLVDDGAVVYLNGKEVYRLNMPAGAITASTTANGAANEGVVQNVNIPSDNLAFGDNVLAVEVHQVNNTSSDIVFGLSILARIPPPTTLSITSQPEDLVVEETKPARFNVAIEGTGANFIWFKDGVAIPNSNFQNYTITNTMLSDAGNYYVIVSNSVNFVKSDTVSLSVFSDTNAPTLVDAVGTISSTNVLVSFSEFVSPSTANSLGNYTLRTTGGQTVNIVSAELQNGTNVLLTTAPRDDGTNYIVSVSNVRDISPRSNVITPNSVIGVSSLIEVINLTDNWHYYNPLPGFDELPGPDWVSLDYNEPSGWGIGGAAFAFDLGNEDLPVEKNTSLSQGAVTSYYRNPFNFTGSPTDIKLRLRYLVDDGAIFYLNGQEILRYNMPSGNVTADTPASASIGTAGLIGFVDLPPTLLHFGTNVLAVELHGIAPNDQDYVFAAELQAEVHSLIQGPVQITRQPRNQTVVEGQTATFDVGTIAGSTFQWRINGTPAPSGTNAIFTIPNVPGNDNGAAISVIVKNNNTPNGVTSSSAILTVLPDMIPPELLGAYGTSNQNQIRLIFNEPVSAATANVAGNYTITNELGQPLAVTAASVSNGTNVLLTVGPRSAGDYVVRINRVTDTAQTPNPIAANTGASVGYSSSVIALDGVWKYNQDGVDLGSTWRQPTYNDSSWASGPALLADETATLPEPIRTNLQVDRNGGKPTFYFRKHFTYTGNTEGATLTVRHVIDDGAVFYLNGVDVNRVGMPTGTILFSTFANRTIGDATFEGPYSFPATGLVFGDNVLAVEVHQHDGASSDIVFGAEVTAFAPSTLFPGESNGGGTNGPAPELTIEMQNGDAVISWDGSGFTLESATDVGGPWNAVSNQSNPYTVTPSMKYQFYRLRK